MEVEAERSGECDEKRQRNEEAEEQKSLVDEKTMVEQQGNLRNEGQGSCSDSSDSGWISSCGSEELQQVPRLLAPRLQLPQAGPHPVNPSTNLQDPCTRMQ